MSSSLVGLIAAPYFLLLVLLFNAENGTVAFRIQSVAVTGRLYCGDKPAANVLVQLYDEDDG